MIGMVKVMQVTYVENSRELRNSIYEIKKPYDKYGVCSWCGKKLASGRWKWCRDDKDQKKYGKCVSEYLAHKGYYKDEVARRNKEKYGRLSCDICKIAIKDMDMPVGDTRYIYDHIQPIALGGSPTDVNNIQIICVKCDKIKTRNDIKEIAKHRNIFKEEKIRVKKEERLNGVFGKKSKWANLKEFQE